MSSNGKEINVLVVGSGIAGPCFAFWLHKFMPSSKITILERAPEPRLGGQAVDIRSAAIPIVRRMGLLDAVKDKTTTEAGMEFVYADGKRSAPFPASGDTEQQSMTSEYEILRGDMAKILYDVTKDMENIEYVFDETIEKVEEAPESGVNVIFAKHLPPATYDVLVGADGMLSRTRRFVFGHGPNNDDYLRRLGQYGAFIKIPKTEDDTNFAQWYNASRGRLVLKRPDQYGTTRAYVGVTDHNLSRFNEIDEIIKRRSVKEQKEWLAKEFDGAGWQCARVISGMWDDDEFYMQQIAQVKMPELYKGHVALVGDAGYCPSPISGVGTGAAIVGAYVLAGELSRAPDDIPAALKHYDATARPFIERVQKIIPGAPQMFNPQSGWGIAAFNTIMGFFSYPFMRRAGGLVGKLVPAFGGTDWELPDYGSNDG